MYFYELHEADDDLFSDALLFHELEFDEQEFLEIVREARARVISGFEEDTLVEAVARDLERRHGFIYVDDSHLRASVNVSADEEETVLAATDEAATGRRDDDEVDEDDIEAGIAEDGAFRTLVVRRRDD